jgi:hypothetical protein
MVSQRRFLHHVLVGLAWHLAGGLRLENDERAVDGVAPLAWSDFLSSAEFWFPSLQNWQSEFFSLSLL